MSEVLEVKGELSQVIDFGVGVADLEKKVKADLAITINGVEDKAGYKLADTRRKEWVKVRTSIDKRRKKMNEAAREHINRVDSVAAQLTDIAAQAEDHVTKLVDAIDEQIAAAERDKADKLFNDRNAQLQHVGLNLPRVLIESLSDAEIEQQVNEKIETDRLRKAESDRLAAEKSAADKLAAEQAEANRKETERLAAERATFEKQQAEAKAEQERLAKIEADRLAAQRAEFERQQAEAQAERDRLQKIADEKVAAERAELDMQRELIAEAQRKIDAAKAAQAKAESDRIAAEEKAKADAFEAERLKLIAEQEAKEAAEKLERDQAEAKAAAERAEALRPDREKLLSVAAAIHAVVIPQVSDELAETVKEINRIVSRAVLEITEAVQAI